MNKFKVGDLVRGTKGHYSFTNEAMTLARVIEVIDDEQIVVKILEHVRSPFIVGDTFDVESQYFDPIKSAPTESTETAAPKIILSSGSTEDTECLACKASKIIERLSEKTGMPTERLISQLIIGAEPFVEIGTRKRKRKGKKA